MIDSRLGRTLVLVLLLFLVPALGGCVEQTQVEPVQSAEKVAVDPSVLQGQTDAFKQYMLENFGGGYGQEPVSWYGSIDSMEYSALDRLVVATSLGPDDGDAIRSIITAVDMYSNDPLTLQITGAQGVTLYSN